MSNNETSGDGAGKVSQKTSQKSAKPAAKPAAKNGKPILIVAPESHDAAHQICGNVYEVLSDYERKSLTGRRVLVWTNGQSESIAASLASVCPSVKYLDGEITAQAALESGWQYAQFRDWAAKIVRVYEDVPDAPVTASDGDSHAPAGEHSDAQSAVASEGHLHPQGAIPDTERVGLHFPQNTDSIEPSTPSDGDRAVLPDTPSVSPSSVAPDVLDADGEDVSFNKNQNENRIDEDDEDNDEDNDDEDRVYNDPALQPSVMEEDDPSFLALPDMPFVPLGIAHGVCYYEIHLRNGESRVLSIPRKAHRADALRELAPTRYWSRVYSKSDPATPAGMPTIDWRRAIEDSIAACERKGHYDPKPTVYTHAENVVVDISAPLPDLSTNNKPLATIENLKEILRRLNVTVRYNVITKEEQINIPRHGFSIDNQANASFAWLVSWCSRFRFPIGNLGEFLTYIADQTPYNPVADWITSKPWDGVVRRYDFYDTVTAQGERDDGEENEIAVKSRRFKQMLIHRWMLSCVAGAFEPNGVSAKGVLVFQGRQHIGKTAWFKSLAPAELNVLRDGMLLRPDDKDSVKQIVSNWIVELGELDATFKRSDIAQLKAFIPKDRDILRRAYARKESEFVRRTLFFASVNPREFLHDTSGNVRFWTIECASINYNHGFDMQQVWAELYECYKKGEPWHLNFEESELLGQHNEGFEVIDPIQELVQSKLEWSDPRTLWNWKTTTEILKELGIERPTTSDATRAAIFIRKANGDAHRRSRGGRLLLVPNKLIRDR